MDDRLPAALEASAIRRQVEANGGNATILHRGDEDRGSILLLVYGRGQAFSLLERTLQDSGRYLWSARDSTVGDLEAMASKRARSDPDLWLIELDVADPQRFIAQFIATR